MVGTAFVFRVFDLRNELGVFIGLQHKNQIDRKCVKILTGCKTGIFVEYLWVLNGLSPNS